MGKLLQPRLERDFIIVKSLGEVNGIGVVFFTVLVNWDDSGVVEGILDQCDAVASYDVPDLENPLCLIKFMVDPRYDDERCYRYIVQKIMQKIHPRNWRTYVQGDFGFNPDV